MRLPKWFVVARNEYRIHTSRIRRIRPYFPYLVIGLLAVYVFFIAPGFVDLFIDEFLALLLSQTAMATVQLILFMIFIYFMIIPITNTLREEQTGQLEIFLAAPIKPSDVLLGEFLGQMPFYTIFVTVVTGFFTAALSPIGLDVAQVAIAIAVFVITFLSALWIGTVVAALLRTKLGRTARGKDIGRALAMIIALPLLALIYAVQFGGLLQALADPGASGTARAILSMLPCSWGAEVVVGFANNPGNIVAVGFETLTRFGGLIVFFGAVLWLGARAADRAYSLEPSTFTASRAKPEGAFYKTVRYVGGGGSFGTVLVSLFKDFGRRLENISNITYMIGLIVLMNIFIVPSRPTGPDTPPIPLILGLFIFPIITVMVTGEVTVRGKETLFVYRKAPSGIDRLVRAMLLKGWLMMLPIAAVVTVVTTMLSPQSTYVSLLTHTGLMIIIVAANVAFVLGLFLLNPAFSEKSVRLWLNIIIAVFSSIGLFLVSLLALSGILRLTADISYILLLHAALSWVVGAGLLYLGKARLGRIE